MVSYVNVFCLLQDKVDRFEDFLAMTIRRIRHF